MAQRAAVQAVHTGSLGLIPSTAWFPEHCREQPPSTGLGIVPEQFLGVAPKQPIKQTSEGKQPWAEHRCGLSVKPENSFGWIFRQEGFGEGWTL